MDNRDGARRDLVLAGGSFEGLTLNNTQFTLLGAFEWQSLPRQAFLIQYVISEGQIDDLGGFSDIANKITLGWKGEISKFGILEFGIIENVFSFDNSADFGIHLGFSRRF